MVATERFAVDLAGFLHGLYREGKSADRFNLIFCWHEHTASGMQLALTAPGLGREFQIVLRFIHCQLRLWLKQTKQAIVMLGKNEGHIQSWLSGLLAQVK